MVNNSNIVLLSEELPIKQSTSPRTAKKRKNTIVRLLMTLTLFGIANNVVLPQFNNNGASSLQHQIVSDLPTNNNNNNLDSDSNKLVEVEQQWVTSSIQHSDSVLDEQDTKIKSSPADDTAIIITSSWIPSHPSMYMIEMVLNSTNLIAGLSPSAPIFITIDNFRLSDLNDLPPDDQKKRLQALEQYTVNLHNTFLTNPRVHIIASVRHLHIGGSVVKVMNLVERHFPTVRYLYYLQHDFSFAKEFNHTALVSAMDEYADKVNYVLFQQPNLWRRIKKCGNESIINLYTQTNVSSKIHPTATYTLTIIILFGSSGTSH